VQSVDCDCLSDGVSGTSAPGLIITLLSSYARIHPMQKLYVWNTRIGPFYIAASGDSFHVIYEDESLGAYATPEQAADDLTGGHTFSIPGAIDTANLGISRYLDKWQRVKAEI